MPLQEQNIDIPLTSGVETKLDALLVGKTKLLSLNNGTFNQNGTIQRRVGWEYMGGTNISKNFVEIGVLGPQLFAVDQVSGAAPTLRCYSQTSQTMVAYNGAPSPFSLSKTSVIRSVHNRIWLDSASSNGYTCFVWFDVTSNTVSCSQLDEAAGVYIVNNLTVSSDGTIGAPRICVAGNKFVIAYNGNGTINAKTLSVGGTTLSGGTSIVTDLSNGGVITNNGLYDMVSLGGDALVVYQAESDTNGVQAVMVSSALAVLSGPIAVITAAYITELHVGCLSVGARTSSTAEVFAGSNAANEVVCAGLSWDGTTLTTLTSGLLVDTNGLPTFIAQTAIGSAVTAFVCSTPTSSNAVKFTKFSCTGGTPSGSGNFITCIGIGGVLGGPYIAARAFTVNGVAYLPLFFLSALQSSMFVVDSFGNVAARWSYGTASSNNGPIFEENVGMFQPPTVTSLSSTEFSIPFFEYSELSINDGEPTTTWGVSRVTLSFGRGTALATGLTPLYHAQTANCVYFSGANMTMFDGQQVSEAGFCYFPENITATAAAGDGLSVGSYQYVALYEWTDGQGQRHQSSPSPPISVTTTSMNKQVTLTCPTLQLGFRSTSTAMSVVFYRTVVDGTTFYRLTAANAPIFNSNAAATVSPGSNDGVADALITGNEILYTIGGALANDAPSACSAIGVYQNRLVFNNSEDPQSWLFSQSPVVGSGLYFNETLLGGRIQQGTGVVNAFAPMDDKLLIFTPIRKFWMTGTGPDATGANSSYNLPQLLPSEVGCADQRSIVVMPEPGSGVAYASKHGLYLTDRGLTDHYSDFGFPIEPFTAEGVTTGVLLENIQQARWTTSYSPSTVLVYDFQEKQWSTFTSTTCSPALACSWNGLWTYYDSAGPCLGQDSNDGVCTDLGPVNPGSQVPLGFTTAWIRLGLLQGFQRIWRAVFFGNFGSDSILQVKANAAVAGYDGAGKVVTNTLNVSHTQNFASSTTWQFRWQQPQQKCQAIQFVVTDTPYFDLPDNGLYFTGLTLQCGVKKGVARLPAGQST